MPDRCDSRVPIFGNTTLIACVYGILFDQSGVLHLSTIFRFQYKPDFDMSQETLNKISMFYFFKFSTYVLSSPFSVRVPHDKFPSLKLKHDIHVQACFTRKCVKIEKPA